VRGTARRLTQLETSTLAKEYKTGATVYELAARFHIHRTTVSGHLHRLEVKMRRQGLDQRQLDQAAIFYALGWSVARIGRHFDVDGGTVWLAFARLGSRCAIRMVGRVAKAPGEADRSTRSARDKQGPHSPAQKPGAGGVTNQGAQVHPHEPPDGLGLHAMCSSNGVFDGQDTAGVTWQG
jgi:hypothetical protein